MKTRKKRNEKREEKEKEEEEKEAEVEKSFLLFSFFSGARLRKGRQP